MNQINIDIIKKASNDLKDSLTMWAGHAISNDLSNNRESTTLYLASCISNNNLSIESLLSKSTVNLLTAILKQSEVCTEISKFSNNMSREGKL